MNVIAVDVGTASVRLAIISFQGENAQKAVVLASHQRDIVYKQDGCKFEQNADEIWKAICDCSKDCIVKDEIDPHSIRGIAFSATCSLVIEEKDGDGTKNDVIMWMDHRALKEAQRITSSGSKALDQFGGVCSPEFSLSKLLWLHDQEPERFRNALGFYELPDWLVHRSIGKSSEFSERSLCCLTCKWGFDADEHTHCDIIQPWLKSGDKNKFGNGVLRPGSIAGYLCNQAIRDLHLLHDSEVNKENVETRKIMVATSLIDAHSGVLAMLSVPLKRYNIEQDLETTICSLAGTSTCHMLLSREPKSIPGIWGPYKNVIVDGYSLLEAGQSMTGKLIEMCIESNEEGKRRISQGESIKDIIRSLNENILEIGFVRSELYVMPSYHGNRSPLANPRLRGGIYGYSSERPSSLLDHYIATVDSLVYETKLIVETLGTKLNTIIISGGLMKNSYYMQTLADTLQSCTVAMSLKHVDFMVMGSGLLARHAILQRSAEKKPYFITRDKLDGIEYDNLVVDCFRPKPERFSYHAKRYACYKEFVEFSLRVDKIINF